MIKQTLEFFLLLYVFFNSKVKKKKENRVFINSTL